MSATTVRQATLARIFKRESRISSTSRCTAARWCGAAPAELVGELRGDACAGGGEWMPDGGRSAVDVGVLAREPEVFLHRQVLRREGLVHLEEIEVLQRRVVPLESLADGGRGTDTH